MARAEDDRHGFLSRWSLTSIPFSGRTAFVLRGPSKAILAELLAVLANTHEDVNAVRNEPVYRTWLIWRGSNGEPGGSLYHALSYTLKGGKSFDASNSLKSSRLLTV